MKKTIIGMAIILCFSSMANAALFNQGDSSTLSFTTLSYIGTTNNSNGTMVFFPFQLSFNLNGTSIYTNISKGSSFQLDVYENVSDTIPYSSLVFGDSPPLSTIFAPLMLIVNDKVVELPPLWNDFEGKLSLTMLSGSMTLDSLDVVVWSGGQTYGKTLDITSTTPASTPIPAAAWLFGSGLFGLVGVRRRA